MSLMPSTQAAPASACTVVPDPVTLTVDPIYTVTVTGGTPFELYEIQVNQAGHHYTDESNTVAQAYADEFGTVVAVIEVADGRPYGDNSGVIGLLWPGTANVGVRRHRTGGGPGGGQAGLIAKCSFTVVG